MYRTNLFILLFSILLIPVIVFAIVDASKSYQAGLMAYNHRNYKKAIKLLETAIEANLSGDELKDAYLKLYFCSYILKDKRRTEHYEGRCHDYIPGFKSIDNTEFKLEFKIIGDQHELENALKGNIPPESIITYRYHIIPEKKSFFKTPYLIQKKGFDVSNLITEVKLERDVQFGLLYLQIKLNKVGAENFKKKTAENLNKRMGIIINNLIMSIPTIREKITNGQFRIAIRYEEKLCFNENFLPHPILNDTIALYELMMNHIAHQ